MSRLEFIQLDRPTGAGGPVLINLAHVKAIEPEREDTADGSRIYLGGLDFVVTMPFPRLLALIETIGKTQ
jgi:hypothetical protein